MSPLPNPITDPELYANVGPSIYWTPEQREAADANLRRAAAERHLFVGEYVDLVAPRPKRDTWPARPL